MDLGKSEVLMNGRASLRFLPNERKAPEEQEHLPWNCYVVSKK
jgi:hypothetical protein